MRVLATTDLHMQLLGHDYVADKPLPHGGLASLGSLIADARAEAAAQGLACVLLDNGDILQGNAFGSWLARQPVTAAHPVAAAFNGLAYDAVGLGNHDLDFGLSYLNQVADELAMPVVCTNLSLRGTGPIQPEALVKCHFPGGASPLHIGVLSVVPEQTARWNMTQLQGRAEVRPARPSLTQQAAALRAQGADLVVLLAHMGIEGTEHGQDPLDSAVPLAEVPGIDAIILGHTHQRFPGRDHPGTVAIDTVRGRLGGRPAIMAGHGGSDLAVMDLTLAPRPDGGWQVTDHFSDLRGNHADLPAHPGVLAGVRAPHEAARRHLAQPVGRIERQLHNYFALAMPTPSAELIARAKADVVRAALQGTPEGDLPLLASTAAHTTGGRSGPGHYLSIPAGIVRRRHLNGLVPYEDPVWALHISGDRLRRWLEHAAAAYARQAPGGAVVQLDDPAIPSFNFDTIYGLTYTIDPTRPVGQRIANLCHADRPIGPEDRFILATDAFRAAGGGGFPVPSSDHVCLRSEVSLSDAVARLLANRGALADPWPLAQPWQFDCGGAVETLLETAPEAAGHLQDIAHLKPVAEQVTDDGFLRIRLTL
ncbi:5'-nucleotidase C-terminal domain-containing protein [Sulfitobacter sp. THAF37]|uniref:5'-nucleotidase C-terminal domain-containing protein n=1 Tax=Sulfitobacter sp. THAF37 TaxID=2587855 RepID=UPI0015621BF5|nr:5'-nucleotidase C-terminal domain-containing protein [Sulfitobacter sp. THAF37]